MSKGRGSGGDDGAAIGCLIMMLLGLFILPIIGIILLFSHDEETKSKGILFLILGIIIWLVIYVYTFG